MKLLMLPFLIHLQLLLLKKNYTRKFVQYLFYYVTLVKMNLAFIVTITFHTQKIQMITVIQNLIQIVVVYGYCSKKEKHCDIYCF